MKKKIIIIAFLNFLFGNGCTNFKDPYSKKGCYDLMTRWFLYQKIHGKIIDKYRLENHDIPTLKIINNISLDTTYIYFNGLDFELWNSCIIGDSILKREESLEFEVYNKLYTKTIKLNCFYDKKKQVVQIDSLLKTLKKGNQIKSNKCFENQKVVRSP